MSSADTEEQQDQYAGANAIRQQVLEQIAVARPVPHVMVRIDDRQTRLDDLFAALVEPVLPDRGVAARRDRGLRHRMVPPGCSSATATLPRAGRQCHALIGAMLTLRGQTKQRD